MTHRDEWLAIQARVEAQERELDEAKAEIDLLRAAHAQKVRESEQLRRELSAVRGLGDPPAPHDPAAPLGARRAFGALAGMVAGSAILGAAMITLGAHGHPGHGAGRALAAPGPIERAGTVSSGGGLFPEGTACTLRVEPVDADPFDCRVEVSCDGQTIYGATSDTGYVRCVGRDRIRDTNVTARDGDPRMELDLARGRVTVEEQLGLGTQRVEIDLAMPTALDP